MPCAARKSAGRTKDQLVVAALGLTLMMAMTVVVLCRVDGGLSFPCGFLTLPQNRAWHMTVLLRSCHPSRPQLMILPWKCSEVYFARKLHCSGTSILPFSLLSLLHPCSCLIALLPLDVLLQHSLRPPLLTGRGAASACTGAEPTTAGGI
jgi:hypothetical protein